MDHNKGKFSSNLQHHLDKGDNPSKTSEKFCIVYGEGDLTYYL